MNEGKAQSFIRYLSSLTGGEKPNTGALAALKRSVAFEPGAYPRSFPYVEPWIEGLEGWPRKAYYLIAGPFAHHQKHQEGRPFARAYREEMEKRGSESLEQRFLTLLDSDEEELVYRLRQAVMLLSDTAFDWVRLLKDIETWHKTERRDQTKVAWARQFYGGQPAGTQGGEEK